MILKLILRKYNNMTEIQSDIELEKKVADMVNSPKASETKLEPSKYYKLNNEHFMFLNSLQFAINKNHNIHEFINRYWIQVFPGKPFPEGRTLQQLKVALQYGIVLNAHNDYHIKATEKFLENCRRSTDFSNGVDKLNTYLDRCESYNSLSKIIINPITFTEGEYQMATKKKKNIVKPKAKTPKEKKPNQCGIITDLLMERKYSDKDILKKLKAVLPNGGADESWIKSLRGQLNTGKRPGIEAPKIPIKEINPPKKAEKPKEKVKLKAKKKVKAKSK